LFCGFNVAIIKLSSEQVSRQFVERIVVARLTHSVH